MNFKFTAMSFILLFSALAYGQRVTPPLAPTPTSPVVQPPKLESEKIRASVMLHGTRGGGESVNVRGIPVLRDLVEKTNCHWVSGEEMMNSAKALNDVFGSLGRLDWYFAAELKAELRYLSFCKTRQLLKINGEDEAALHAAVDVHTSQAAIRLNSDVYLDVGIFNAMSEDSKAFLLIHEVLHSYLDGGLERRNQKLRSMTKSLEQVHRGLMQTRKELHLQMTKNEVAFPLTVGRLSNHRPQIEYVLGNEEEKRDILSKQRSFEGFFKKFSEIDSGFLLGIHRPLLALHEIWSEKVRIACEAGDKEAFLLYLQLSGDELRSHGICALASDLSHEAAPLARLILEHFRSGKYQRLLTEKLSGQKLLVSGGRLLATPALSLVSASPATQPVRLIGLTATFGPQELVPEFAALAKLLQSSKGEVNELLDPNLLRAFDINAELQALETIVLNYSRERDLGLQRLPLIYQYFWDAFIESFNFADREALRNLINNNNLGYQI